MRSIDCIFGLYAVPRERGRQTDSRFERRTNVELGVDCVSFDRLPIKRDTVGIDNAEHPVMSTLKRVELLRIDLCHVTSGIGFIVHAWAHPCLRAAERPLRDVS